MDILHITQTKNISSIMKHGILRHKSLFDQYDDVMKRDYGDDYDSERGLVFGFPETIDRRDKYIKDFFYWKTWGTARNVFLKDCDYEQYNKYQEDGPKVFRHLKINPIQFSVLLIDIPHIPMYDWYLHVQNTCMGELWRDMDTRYEHSGKPLVLVNYDIPPQSIKKVIGTGESIISKNNKIEVSLKI